MYPRHLLLKIYGEKHDGEWSLICLNFSLAAQAPTQAEAKALLESQIKEYIREAVEVDSQYAEQLFTRRAPLMYWIKWWYKYACSKFDGRHDRTEAFREPVPLVPA